MRIIKLSVTLKSHQGKTINMDHDLTPEDIIIYKKRIVDTFDLYGFPGALVTIAAFDGTGDILPVLAEKPKPVVEHKKEPIPVIDLDNLPQYPKRKSIMDYFKRK